MKLTLWQKLQLLVYFLSGAALFASFWQLEIIWWCQWWNWPYNFGGLGDFGWQLYTWRDFWYAIIFLVFVSLIVHPTYEKKREAKKGL